MQKILTFSSFTIASLIMIAIFITTTTYLQLAIAVALYPLLIYFAYKIFPIKTREYHSAAHATVIQPVVESTKRESVGISDIDKRAFLKLIGVTGLSFFLLSIFNKKTEGLFTKTLPGSEMVSLKSIDGNKIEPAQSHPTDGYRISEIDDNAITYYGFTNKDGAWFVMKEDTDTGSFRYSKGDANFSGNWTNRENLKYDYFSKVF